MYILYTSVPGLQFVRTQGGNDFVKAVSHHHLEVDTDSDNTIVSDESWKTLGSHNEDTVPFKVSRASGDAA
ncbi:unnamed protein product [Hymenolepis diminuta]|uniref:Uncharacterized protein n=1 Tax=Hymenolepis diminuta TaxID=6216 RepID=A0A564Z0Q5_HYMDI|nr:unnamed protein product [Hymenolepis diminuta]